MAHIVAVCSSDRRGDPKTDYGQGELRAGYGLVGDSHAGYSEREVSLLELAAIEAVNAEYGIGAVPGSFAENLTIVGMDLLTLRVGDRLRVGTALLDVVQIGKPLDVTHTYDYRGVSILPRKGIFCRILRGGHITQGDVVEIET
jgi:MOSC domain-containing protein YiiM